MIRIKDPETSVSRPRWVGGFTTDPVERAKRPRAQTLEPGTVWTVAQLRAFLNAARQHRLFAFFHVAAYTGARRGELLNLQWSAVDLDGKKIAITGSAAVIGGERINGVTKSCRTRVVSIDDATVAVRRQHRADQAADQLRAGDAWRGTQDGYIFTTSWGGPIYPDTVTSLMAKLIGAYNKPERGPRPKNQLPHARLHDLRHLHATTLADQWRSRISEFVGVKARQLGGGRAKLRGTIDIITLQTLARQTDVSALTAGVRASHRR